jgi:alkylation response protein AidB-like acyl-CoA dehydrogenase
MDFDLTPEEEAFRDEVRRFIAENHPGSERPEPEAMERWNQKLVEKRWIGFSWPRELGGGGGTVIQQFLLKEEMAAAKAPALGSDFMGLTWVGPSLIRWGSEEQKRRFLPDLLNTRSLWCTGYSEPDHGSDLGSLQCRAVLDGDQYIVNGQKIWTTQAHRAQWIFMLVRTDADPSRSRYRGITCLLIPMDSPGIEVRAVPNLLGVHSFNQVFFDDVRVPLEYRLGEEGQGWMVVMGALAHERSGISEATEKTRHLADLIELARRSSRNGRPALEDDAVRRRLASFQSRIAAMRLTGMRHLTQQLRGEPPSSETSVNKLLRGQLEIEMSELAGALHGPAFQGDGPWQQRSLDFHGTVIGGGTPNIQRNIIAERILGLPRD